MGLTGGQDFQIEVSQDNVNWSTALTVKRDNSGVEIGTVRSGGVFVSPNSVASIPTPQAGGIVLVMLSGGIYPQVNHSGIFAYDTGPSLSLLKFAGGIRMQAL